MQLAELCQPCAYKIINFAFSLTISASEQGGTQKKGGRINQDISLRVHQNRTVKLFKTMRILLKKLKARHLTVNEKLLKKVLKLRKWLDMFDQIIKKL